MNTGHIDISYKEKKALWDKTYRENNLEKLKHKQKQYYESNKETLLAKRKERYAENPEKFCAKEKERRLNFPEKELLNCARKRAKNKGIEFDITVDDIIIPLNCPVLGVPLNINSKGFSPDSPSLDRINSNLGYVKGNVAVISLRANKIKADATFEELSKIIKWMSEQ